MTAPTINGTRYPQPIEDLLPAARALDLPEGETFPSRNRLMREFRIGAPKAGELLALLKAEPTAPPADTTAPDPAAAPDAPEPAAPAAPVTVDPTPPRRARRPSRTTRPRRSVARTRPPPTSRAAVRWCGRWC